MPSWYTCKPSAKNNPLKTRVAILCLLSCLFSLSVRAQSADSVRFSRYYVASHQVGFLQWNAVPGANAYGLYRHFPGQDGYTLCASVADTHYLDTLHRIICSDTVGYCLQAYRPTDTLVSDTVGLYYEDNLPTSPCRLRVATVWDNPEQIHLSWYASPDTDVMGYYICMGNPCRDFDTVWGRLNTTYSCHDSIDCHAEHNFRILAFDSCFQASPLTPYYHNPVLHLTAGHCSRKVHATWNRYINMPDSVGIYILWYRLLGTDTTLHHKGFAGNACPFSYDLDVDSLDIWAVEARVAAYAPGDSLGAESAWERLVFDVGDTAEYLRITSAEYDDAIPAVSLTFDIDSTFQGHEYHLLRASAVDTQFSRIATLSSPAPYTDFDINRTALRYIYRLEVPDICHQRVTYSDTLGVSLPPVDEITAWLPNVIIPGHATCGLFCPYFLSPISSGYSFEVYNRWGERLFRTETITDCWDGTAGGNILPQGTYVYRIRCRHADGSEKIYFGNITIVK